MRHGRDVGNFEADVTKFFSSELAPMARERGWTDPEWTRGINKRLADIGREYGFLVFASRCQNADGPEWLYDHHWRVCGDGNTLIRIPLAMEIEWTPTEVNFGEVVKDFFKLVQARADLRVMVFQGNDVISKTEQLIAMAENFEGTQQGDRWLFVGWDGNGQQMHCRSWSA